MITDTQLTGNGMRFPSTVTHCAACVHVLFCKSQDREREIEEGGSGEESRKARVNFRRSRRSRAWKTSRLGAAAPCA